MKTESVCGLPLRTAPKKAKGAKVRDWQQKLVPHVLEACIEGKDAPVAELAKAVQCDSPNFVATALGAIRGGGLNMWKADTAIMACQENVAISLAFLYPDCDDAERLNQACVLTGKTPQELQEAFTRLPIAYDVFFPAN